MPFRGRRRWRFERFVLPVFTSTVFAMIVVWLWFCFDAVGGIGRSTYGQRLLIFGFAGIPVFVVLGVVVTVFLLQSAAYDNLAEVMGRVQSLASFGTIYVLDGQHPHGIEELTERLRAYNTLIVVRDPVAAEVGHESDVTGQAASEGT